MWKQGCYLSKLIGVFKSYIEAESATQAIHFAFGAPANFYGYTGKFFVVMIGEIQYMTEHIFYDKEKK